MALRLSEADQAEYERRCRVNQERKEDAIRRGDPIGAKKARQANTQLYQEFQAKQLSEEYGERAIHRPPGLEERVERLELIVARLTKQLGV